MIVLGLSDLHWWIGTTRRVHGLREEVRLALKKRPAKIFMLLGDIAESPNYFDECLQCLTGLGLHKFCIPGNHDLYRSLGYSTHTLRSKILPEIAQRYGFQFGYAVERIDNVVLVMNPCWHNLSWRPPGRSFTQDEVLDEYGTLRDAKELTVPYDRLHQEDMMEFQRQMDTIEEIIRPGDTLIVGTHWPIMRETYQPFIPHNIRHLVTPRIMRGYTSAIDAAFMAHEFGDLLVECIGKMKIKPSKVHVISGHTHFGIKKAKRHHGVLFTSRIIDCNKDNVKCSAIINVPGPPRIKSHAIDNP